MNALPNLGFSSMEEGIKVLMFLNFLPHPISSEWIALGNFQKHPMDKNIPNPNAYFAQIHPAWAKKGSSALQCTLAVY